MTEWKPVVGYEGCYEVSDRGQVRSLSRMASNGRFWRGRVRKISVDAKSGYQYLGLRKDGEGRTRRIHELVLEAFVGPRPKGYHCCHFDGDKLNNNLENLRWDTPIANHKDKVRHGTVPVGSRHPNATFCEVDVSLIRGLDFSPYYIAKFFGWCEGSVRDIKSGEIWRHVD